MMDHVREESKVDPGDDSVPNAGEEPSSYYYDDATNYVTYRDDEEDDNESPSQGDEQD